MEQVCLRDVPGVKDLELDFWRIEAYMRAQGVRKTQGPLRLIFIYDNDGELVAMFRQFMQENGRREFLYPGHPDFEVYLANWKSYQAKFEPGIAIWAGKLAQEHPEYAQIIYRNWRKCREWNLRDWIELRMG